MSDGGGVGEDVREETAVGEAAGSEGGAGGGLHWSPLEAAVVAASALFVFVQLHPDLVLTATTPAGGDMGAHVWALAVLRDDLLPSLQLSGWSPDWYAGFPAFHFYMVVPFLAMVVLNAGSSTGGAVAAFAVSLLLSVRARGRLTPLPDPDAPGSDLPDSEGPDSDVSAGGVPPRRWSRTDLPVVGAVAVAVLVAVVSGIWTDWSPALHFWLMVAAAGFAVLALLGVRGTRPRAWAVMALAVALVGVALPYGTAFKVVSIAGVVAMPVCAALFAKLAGWSAPIPALFSVGTLAFLFDKSFTIYGGNIASTMAGEFAFSISLALAIAYLGVVVAGLRDGGRRPAAAVLLALVGLCHVIVVIFALGATAVLYAVHIVAAVGPSAHERSRARWIMVGLGVAVIVVGALVWWRGPFTTGPVLVVTTALLVLGVLLWWTRVPAVSPAGAPRSWWPRTWWLVSVGGVAGLLASWWILPFYLRRTHLNDMGWEKTAVHRDGRAVWDWFVHDVWSVLVVEVSLFAALALVGAVLAVILRDRVGVALVAIGICLAVAFVYVPQGRLWNARLLPFWYLVVYLLAAYGVAETVRSVSVLVQGGRPAAARRLLAGVAPVCLLVLTGFLGGQLRNFPGGATNPDGSYRVVATVGIPGLFSLDVPDALAVDVRGRNFVTDWARWNYSGYEGKDAYPEYRAIVSTMADVGRTHGCGRALWEYRSELNLYGTPMALMLLPHWTSGCIGSMEGLYFEASTTTPFHFLVQSELSSAPSRPQRDLPYGPLDLDLGVAHLQMLGVRYYMAQTEEAVAAADAHPDLERVAESEPWAVYLVADAPLVEALTHEPAVTTVGQSQHTWLCGGGEGPGQCRGPAVEWFLDPDGWDVALASDGPSSWQRIGAGEEPEARPVAPATVSDVSTGRERISFRVDRPGTPVLVKASYFPTWQASGADGPYRVSPNLMVVVPTSEEVVLEYRSTPVDWAAWSLTALGLVGLFWLVRAPAVAVRRIGPDPQDLIDADDAAADGDRDGDGG